MGARQKTEAKHPPPRPAKEMNDSSVISEQAMLFKNRHINGRIGLWFFTLRPKFAPLPTRRTTNLPPSSSCIMGHENKGFFG
jgi:hypothetical protein